eukprot:scaffold61848_cov50-Phaeocystis_antarctica.AAC.2
MGVEPGTCLTASVSYPRHTSPGERFRCRRAGSNRQCCRAATRWRREGVLHEREPDSFERRQAHARPAGRGDGARNYREPQGQGSGRALPRQQGQRQLLPYPGPPPPRLLRLRPCCAPHTRRRARDTLCRGTPALAA